jgi:hypothetical protein
MEVKLKEYPDMFTRNSKGEILVYKIRVKHSERGAALIFESGRLTGKLTYREHIVGEGKNLGKSNETTPFEQACSDAEGRILKKQHEGYKTLEALGVTITLDVMLDRQVYLFKEKPYTKGQVLEAAVPEDRTDKSGNIKPMKAQKYFKETAKGTVPRVKFPTIGQPKINGVRAFLQWNEDKGAAELLSKNGLEYTTVSHILEILKREHFVYNPADYFTWEYADDNELGVLIFDADKVLIREYPVEVFKEADSVALGAEKLISELYSEEIPLVFDGELYIRGEILSEIVSAVKKLSLKSQLVEFRSFDLAIDTYSQAERLKMLRRLDAKYFANKKEFVRVPNVLIRSHIEAVHYTDKCIDLGYEGAIFRDTSAVYAFGKRPQTMVKFKKRESAEFKILDVIDSDKAPGLAIFVCRNNLNSLEFKVNPEGSHEIKEKYFKDRHSLIGKLLTVEFYERTTNDLPFHTVGIAVRDYE